MPQVGVAITAWWAGLTAFQAFQVIAFVAMTAYSVHSAQRARRAQRDAWNASLRDRNVTVRSAIAPRTILYGKVSTGGTLVYAQSSGANNTLLTLVVAAAGHDIQSYENIYLDGEDILPLASGYAREGSRYNPLVGVTQSVGSGVVSAGALPLGLVPAGVQQVYTSAETSGDNAGISVPFTYTPGNNYVTVDAAYNGQTLYFWYASGSAYTSPRVSASLYYGTTGQTADAWLTANSSGAWTANHKGSGVAYVILHLSFDEAAFPTGIPPVKLVAKGKKCYDPRSGLTVWTDNPALIARDYLTSPLGFGCEAAEVDDTLISAAANVCDELVTLDGIGTQQARYRCNTLISTENSPLENLDMILSSMAGTRSYSQGQWRIHAGAYSAPVMALTEAMIVGNVGILPRAPRSDLFNEVKGTYVDPAKDWEPTDFPAVKNATYVTQDGGDVLATDVTLPCTTDAWQAQRIAKIVLEQARQALTVQAMFNLAAYKVQPGENVTLTVARYGFASKVFKCVRRRFDPTQGVELTLREEASAVYDWNYGEATVVDPAPNTALPDPYALPTLAGVALSSGTADLLKLADGTIISRIKVSWTAVTDARVLQGGRIEVEFRQGGEAAWRATPAVMGSETRAYCFPVFDGKDYYVRVRAVNALAVPGIWQYFLHTVTGKTAAPANLTSMSVAVLADGTRRFTINAPTGVVDGSKIAVRYVAGSSSTWAAMTYLFDIDYDKWLGVYYFETALPVEGTWSFGAKLIDTTGNESATAVFITNAALGTHPKRYDSTFNRLLNADFTVSLGAAYDYPNYFSDASPVPSWSYGKGGTQTAVVARNFEYGARWNVGAGGCVVYLNAGNEASAYQYLSQVVPVDAGVDYEFSVYVSPHACGVSVAVDFVTAGDVYLGSMMNPGSVGSETFTGGATTSYGDAYDPIGTWHRMFRYGTAPATAAKAIVYLVKLTTTSGQAESYAFWHKAQFCKWGGGTTNAEALPWVPPTGVESGGAGTGNIQPGAATTVSESKPADSNIRCFNANAGTTPSNTTTVTSLSWTNTTGEEVLVAAHASVIWQLETPTSIQFAFGGMAVLLDSVDQWSSNNFLDILDTAQALNKWLPWAHNFSIAVPAGSTVEIRLRAGLGRLAPGTSDGYVKWKGMAVQLQAIKR